MRILNKIPKTPSPGNKRIFWQIPLALLLLMSVFVFGYISNPDWNLDATIQSIKKTLIKTDQAILQDIRQEMGLYTSNGLTTIFLDIPFDSLLTIEAKRTEALISGILLTSDEDFVPASMHLNDGESFPVKIRLKGDWTDHLEGDKWSFRIHVEDSQHAILGMRRFSIQAPETRNYESEWAYHQNLLQEGILTPRYYFVNVVQNGKFNGIYALEESFTEDLLESQGKREGPIIRYSEDLLWKNWENLGKGVSEIENAIQEIGRFWLTNAGNSEITAFRQNHITQDELLAGELFAAIDLLSSFNQDLVPGEEVFDQDLWGKYFALTDVWGAGHSTSWHNLRFYYNPITGLLEPVVFDALPFESSATRDRLAFPFAERGSIQKIFRLPGIQKSYVSNLERLTNSSYINGLETSFGQDMNHFHEIMTGYLEQGIFGDIPPLPWSNLRQRASILKKNLRSPQPIMGNYKIIQVNGLDYLQLDLTNLMVLPVEMKELNFNGVSYPLDLDWCGPQNCQQKIIGDIPSFIIKDQAKLTLQIPMSILSIDIGTDPEIILIANLWGGSTVTENPILDNYTPEDRSSGTRPRTELEFALNNHEFLIQTAPGKLDILSGSWEVKGDLILPDGFDLFIPAGTTLLFESGAVLVVNGSLHIEGLQEKPILLAAKETSWGGIFALGNGRTESNWNHVEIKDTAGIIRDGWVLTGGITFYENDLHLQNVRISENSAEDALNIIRSEFSFRDVEFYKSTSDAFDGDFTKGTITDCILDNISGDGFDFSGSIVTIIETSFIDIGDKAISAGEKSIVYISDSIIENTSIGIASKDLSEVTADNLTITNARITGLAAYIKKPQYGSAYLNASNIQFNNTLQPALCQTDSVLILSGNAIDCIDIDVESLYDQGVLGN
jgi:hypothetical protein